MTKKILIIGGTGDIGKAISKKFLTKDTHSLGSKDLDLAATIALINFSVIINFYMKVLFLCLV